MAYINYQNLPNTSTPLNATNLNSMQVEESGTTANGNYIKYNDGTLICNQTKNFTGLSFTSSGTLYKCDISSAFTFPVGFINAPTIAVQTQSDSDYSYSFVYGTRRTTTAITSIELMRIVSASNVTIPIGYIAVGRWK